MLESIRKVRGAVATKDLVPVLKSFHVDGNRIQGANGRIAISTPFPDLELRFVVPADKFLKAVDTCGGEPRIDLQKDGRLVVRHEKFRATIATMPPDDYPLTVLRSSELRPVEPILPALKAVRPFVGTDATRMWSHGALVKDRQLWATNNVTLVRCPFPMDGELVLPSFLMDELLRIGDEPAVATHNDNTVQFAYDDGTWISSVLIAPAWPDVDKFFQDKRPVRDNVHIDELKLAVQQVAPFCPDLPVVRLGPHGVSTEDGHTMAEVSMNGLPECRFRIEPLLAALELATSMDLTSTPYRFSAPGIDGVMIGLR